MAERGIAFDAPASVAELIERIDAAAPGLPKRLRQCAAFTRRHLHLVAVSTVAEMARAADVAPSVYMRFCQGLGFSGYSEMQALLRARHSAFRPDYGARLASLREASGAAPPVDRLIAEFAESGHRSLLRLGSTVISGSAERIARDMAEARMVHLAGTRRAYSVVVNMAYLLDKLGLETRLHPGAGLVPAEAALRPGDVVFAVTFAPYSAETRAFAAMAARAGATVHGLTDVERWPDPDVLTELLVAREDEVAGLRAPTAAIALTTALSVAAGAQRADA